MICHFWTLVKIGNDQQYERLFGIQNALWDVNRDGIRQADPHHGVSADAGLSVAFRAVRRLAAGLFRLEYATADQRTDHDKRERRGWREQQYLRAARLVRT